MIDILTRAGCFIAIILMGHLLRRAGFFKQEDFHLLSRLVINITLTAAIVVNFQSSTLEVSMLLLSVLGLLFGLVLIALAWLMEKRRGQERQAFSMVNIAGCNLGNFVLPFAMSFLGPTGVMAVSLFDLGNGMICLGGSYSLACMVKNGEGRFSMMPILRALVRSVPLMTLFLMTVMNLAHLQLPSPVLDLAKIIANANAFMAMLMIGVGFRLDGNISQVKDIARILGVRFGLGITMALLSYFVLPFPEAWRQALVLLFLAPVSSSAPAFTARMDGDFGLASASNSVSILVSIVLITTSLTLML